MVPAADLFAAEIEPDHFIMEKTRAGKSRQRPKIYMCVVKFIMPGNIPGQHARIRSVRIATDKCQAQPRYRLHAELLEDSDMAVSSAYEDKIFNDRSLT